jgi:hypothetical protein
MKAIIGKNRPDVPIITDLFRPHRWKRQENPETPGANGEKAFQRFHAEIRTAFQILPY